MLKKESITKSLKKEYRKIDIHVHDVIDSTNTEAKRLAEQGAIHGTTVFADTQTHGRGRLGRNFFSPDQTGIYMTILLEAKKDLSQTVLITSAASVAVSRAIKSVYEIESQIKWVNDIYINEKKVCGILAEAITDTNTGNISHIALGIGINLFLPKEGFPKDLKNKAGALFEYELLDFNREQSFPSGQASYANSQYNTREIFSAELINQILDVYADLETCDFIKEYNERSMVIGKEVEVVKHYRIEMDTAEKTRATVLDINPDGSLLVRYGDGIIENLSTGEISLRW